MDMQNVLCFRKIIMGDCRRVVAENFWKPIVNTWGFVGHMIFVIITQFWWENSKVALDNTQLHWHGCVPIRFYLQK